MPKSFEEFVKEQSIRLGSSPEKKREMSHTKAHRREPHIPHPLVTKPTMEEKEQVNEILGTLAAAAGGAALGAYAMHRATRKGGVVDRVRKERERKDRLRKSIEISKQRTKNLQAQLNATSYKKAIFGEEAPAVSVAGNAVPSITDPTTNYAMQKKRYKNMLRRKPPK